MPSAKPHIILIDGESGVGKSTLAKLIASTLDARLIQLDDVYPGWDGLERGRDTVIRDVLVPLSRGETGRLTLWDWAANKAGTSIDVEPADVIVVEGCGISTPESRTLASTVLWVRCDETERRQRRAHRDGSAFIRELATWDEQVHRHIDRNDPVATATVIVET